MPDPYSDALSIGEACRELREQYGHRVPYNAVWRAVNEGEVPAFRRGRYWYISREDQPRIAIALGFPASTGPHGRA